MRRLLATVVLLGACTAAPRPVTTTPLSPAAERAERLGGCPATSEAAWTSCVLGRLTLREKAAQMVWPSVFGDYVSADSPQWQKVTRWITDDAVGGFTMSIGSPTEIAAKLNAMQRMSALPLMVGADLEQGAGYRARGGLTATGGIDLGGAVVFPPPMAVGATGDTALAYEMGRVTALEGLALGIPLDYAPVLDVNNNPANPVINTRSFGEDPHAVARLGAAFVRGMQEHGMIATGKHFPGHGDTDVNSHLGLPVIHASRAELDTVELVPFRAAVQAGLGAMMTMHGVVPALDSTGVPATLSPKVIGGLLRGELGFQGLVFTDAMDMAGVLQQFGAAEAAKRAVAAGADILIQPLDVEQTIDAVVAGAREGRYDEQRLDASVRRILGAKFRSGLVARRTVDLDTLRRVVGDSAHEAVARRIAERSMTLVRDSARLLPLGRLDKGTRVLSVTIAPRSNLLAGRDFDAELRRTFPKLRTAFVDQDDPGPGYARIASLADSADVVLLGSYVSHNWQATSVAAASPFVDLVAELTRHGRKPMVVSFGNPYVLQQIPAVPGYLVAWGAFPVEQVAAARALVGAIPITGRLPIRIPPVAPLGAGETRDALPAAATSTR